MNRGIILSEVLDLYSEIEERQEKINKLYEIVKGIEDTEDDKKYRYSYLQCIKSYTTL